MHNKNHKIICVCLVFVFLISLVGCSRPLEEYLVGYSGQDIADNIEIVTAAKKLSRVELYEETASKNISVKSTDKALLKDWQDLCSKMQLSIEDCDVINYPAIGGLPAQIVFTVDGKQVCIGLYSGGAFYTPLEGDKAQKVVITNYEEIHEELTDLIARTKSE